MNSEQIACFFDNASKDREKWVKLNWYYHKQILKFLRMHIPENRAVLEIGCGTGHLLNKLSPSKGVGIDFSKEMVQIASQKYPNLHFVVADAANYELVDKFDYILITDTIGYFEDIQKVFSRIRQNCTNKTRIIITTYNHLWEPVSKFSELIGLRVKHPFTNWLSANDVEGLLSLEDYDVVEKGDKILIPKYIPLISTLFNRYFVHMPFFRNLCLVQYIIARPMNLESNKERSVSIVVAARNEKGNIEKIVQTLPNMGEKTEIVFVEGGSSDNTWDEILRVANKYKDKNIKYAKQDGIGKGDAVRKGFEIAVGDILMIYDADLTVPPNDLLKFYNAINSNKGEFINGTRLVYPMEKQAMRTLNLFGNKMFSILFSWLLGQRLKDTLCGTKVISKYNYNILKENRAYFGEFDPFGDFDLLFGASKMSLKIVEIPIRYQERTYGSTNIDRFSHGWLLIKMCLFAMKKIKFV